MDNKNNNSNRFSGLKNMLRALRHRNFRLFFCGQGISILGIWMQQLAMSWLVYRLTGSALLLGVLGFTAHIPFFLISPFAGVLVDRWNRHKLIIVTQILLMMEGITLAVLVLTGKIEVWHIIFLSIFAGIVNSFDMPARQTFVVNMIEDKEDLGNAISLNSSLFNGAKLIGPSIAGVIISAVGEGICFLLNGLSYIAVIAALFAMKITRQEVKHADPNIINNLKEGFKYAFSSRPIKSIIMLISVMSLIGLPFFVLMPVYVKDILHGGPQILGFLMGVSGIGAVSGSFYLASMKRTEEIKKMIPIGAMIFGIGTFFFYFSHSIWLSTILVILAGFGITLFHSACNTVIQMKVEEEKRGRVMSIYTFALMGISPFGSLFTGYLASRIGTSETFLLCGIACIISALVFTLRYGEIKKIVHPAYEKIDFLPDSLNNNAKIRENSE